MKSKPEAEGEAVVCTHREDICYLIRAIRRHTLWTRGFTLLYKHAIAEIQLYYTSKHYGSTT